MGKTKKEVWLIIVFLVLMAILTAVCNVVSQQQMPVAAIQQMEVPGVIPEKCLYYIKSADNAAVIYIAEGYLADDADSVQNVVAREKTVILKEKLADGWRVSGMDISGICPVVVWASRPISDGIGIRAQRKETLSETGTIIFVNADTGERKEFSVQGIVREEEERLRTDRGLDKTWVSYQFVDEAEESAPAILRVLLWITMAFCLAAALLYRDMASFSAKEKRKLDRLYLSELTKRDTADFLLHIIWWLCLVFAMAALCIACSRLDFSFLSDWLPEDRVIDIQHYTGLYREWRAKTSLYMKYYEDAWTEELYAQMKEWKSLLYQTIAAGMAGVVPVGKYLLKWYQCRHFRSACRRKTYD